MATIFSRIIAGEIPCYKVAEDDRFFAFLDINPLVKGHTLVIPKQEVDYIFDLNDEDLAAMHVFAKRVALAIGKAFPCRSGIGAGSASCAHTFDSYAERKRYAFLQSQTETDGRRIQGCGRSYPCSALIGLFSSPK